MKFAQIQNNRAHWVFEADAKPEFAPNIVLVDITDKPEVQEGWKYIDGKFIDPTPTLNELKESKKSEIATARFKAETAGIQLSSITIETDRESQALITGAVVQAIADPTYSLQWKTPTGFIPLTAEQIKAVGVAVRKHVQDCFDKEAELLKKIEAAKTKEELAAVVWEENPLK